MAAAPALRDAALERSAGLALDALASGSQKGEMDWHRAPVARRVLSCLAWLLTSGLIGGHRAGAGEASAPASARSSAAAPAGFSLTVRVRGLRNARGTVAVALFATARDFPDQKRALAGRVTKIDGGRAAVTFPGVAPGIYAVAVLHDENDNARMDFNFLGMPREGYGFSNDASAPFGPPSFAAAAFRLSPRPSYIAIEARYLL